MNNTSTRTRVSRGQLFRRWLLFVVLSVLGLQLYFVARVAMMRFVDPQSSAFERSQIVQILKTNQRFRWRQQWVPATRIHSSLGRAVIASEDDLFASHDGVQWQAIERAWTRNEKAQIRSISKGKPPKVVGGQRCVWCASGCAALFFKTCVPTQCLGISALGGDAAATQVF